MKPKIVLAIYLVIVFSIAFYFNILYSGITGAATYSSCSVSTVTQNSQLSQNVVGGTVDCFTIDADNIVFDCKGYSITGAGGNTKAAVKVAGHSGVIIQNCVISNWGRGVHAAANGAAGTNATVINISIDTIGTGGDLRFDAASNMTVINSSYAESNIVWGGNNNLTRNWFLQVNVTTGGSALSGVKINATNEVATLQYTGTTPSDGLLILELPYYLQNGSGEGNKTYYTYNITANMSGYNDKRINVNLSGSSNLTIIMTASGSNAAPLQCVISYPIDGGNYSSLDINYTCVDPDGDSLGYNVFINGLINQSNITTNVSIFNASDGFYNVTVQANDSNAIGPNSTYVYFRIDTTAPTFSGNETNSSGARINDGVQFNITVTDDIGLRYWVFSWNGTGQWDNLSNGTLSGSSVKLVVNKTLTIGTGNITYYSWYVNDSAGNWNQSLTRTFTVAANNPPASCQIVYPVDGKNYSSVDINYTCTDADSDALRYYIWINGSLNQSGITGNATNWQAGDGFYNLTAHADDNRDNSSNATLIHFRTDTKGPSWTNNKTNSSGAKINYYVQFNITATDNILLTNYIFSWNDTGLWANTTATTTGISVDFLANKTITASRGTVIGYRWYANDTLENQNNSKLRTFLIGNAAPTTSTISNKSWVQDNNLIFSLNSSFSDADNDPLNWTYNLDGGNINVTINNLTGSVTLTPNYTWRGTHYLIFNATDGTDWTQSNNVTLTVTEAVGSGSGGGGGGGGGDVALPQPPAETLPAETLPAETLPAETPTETPTEPEITIPDDTPDFVGDTITIIFSGEGASASNINEFIDKYNNTKGNVEINRTLRIDNQTNRTIINITIIPKRVLYNFSYYEKIPKCIALLIKHGLLEETGIVFRNKNFTVIQEDPIIMWKFAEVREPLDLSYEVKKTLEEECLELLEGFGIADALGPLIEQPRKIAIYKILRIVIPVVVIPAIVYTLIHFSRFAPAIIPKIKRRKRKEKAKKKTREKPQKRETKQPPNEKREEKPPEKEETKRNFFQKIVRIEPTETKKVKISPKRVVIKVLPRERR